MHFINKVKLAHAITFLSAVGNMESKTDIIFDDEEEGELVNWKVIDGAYISADAILLIYENKSGEKKSLKTSVSGVVTIDTTIKKGKVSMFDVDI